MERMRDVGPLSYYPANPSLHRTDHIKTNTIGNSERTDLVQKVKVPGPGNYQINSDFEKANEKPKFHMGIKT